MSDGNRPGVPHFPIFDSKMRFALTGTGPPLEALRQGTVAILTRYPWQRLRSHGVSMDGKVGLSSTVTCRERFSLHNS